MRMYHAQTLLPLNHSVVLFMEQVQQAMLWGGGLFCLGYCFLRYPQGLLFQLLQVFAVDVSSQWDLLWSPSLQITSGMTGMWLVSCVVSESSSWFIHFCTDSLELHFHKWSRHSLKNSGWINVQICKMTWNKLIWSRGTSMLNGSEEGEHRRRQSQMKWCWGTVRTRRTLPTG